MVWYIVLFGAETIMKNLRFWWFYGYEIIRLESARLA